MAAVKITCLTCQKQVAKLESARSCNNEDEDHGEIKKKEAKQFAINQQFILGCHEAGLGPDDADIVCSAMNLPLAGTESSKAPINHLFGCHDYCSESWCPVKSGKSVSNGKYHDKEKETKLYDG